MYDPANQAATTYDINHFPVDNQVEQNYAMIKAIFLAHNAEAMGYSPELNGSRGLIKHIYCMIRKEYEYTTAGLVLPLSHYDLEFKKTLPPNFKVRFTMSNL